MVKIFWKVDDPCAPLKELEFCELRLVDLGGYEMPRFLVGEFHAHWSETHQRVIWVGCQDEMCSTAEEAEQSFEKRKAAIAETGFMRSDVETLTA
jgi:hypothetical protein